MTSARLVTAMITARLPGTLPCRAATRMLKKVVPSVTDRKRICWVRYSRSHGYRRAACAPPRSVATRPRRATAFVGTCSTPMSSEQPAETTRKAPAIHSRAM